MKSFLGNFYRHLAIFFCKTFLLTKAEQYKITQNDNYNNHEIKYYYLQK